MRIYNEGCTIQCEICGWELEETYINLSEKIECPVCGNMIQRDVSWLDDGWF